MASFCAPAPSLYAKTRFRKNGAFRLANKPQMALTVFPPPPPPRLLVLLFKWNIWTGVMSQAIGGWGVENLGVGGFAPLTMMDCDGKQMHILTYASCVSADDSRLVFVAWSLN